MAVDLSYLFNGSPPAAVTTPAASTSTLPDWYQQYIQNIASKGTQVAGAQATAGYPKAQVADFAKPTTDSFSAVQNLQGAYQPALTAASGIAGQEAGNAATAATNANADVAGPTQSFTGSNVAQYMSPYTSQVVDSLNKVANLNWNNNIMPGIQANALGSGIFGSTRNADLLGQAGANFQTGLNAQDAQALQSGFQLGATNFQADQARAQAQQQLQANTALQGGTLAQTAANQGATQMGALAQLQQNLGLQGATALNAVGQQQQAQNQQVLNTNQTNQVNTMNQDWTNLNNLSALIRGNSLPTSSMSVSQGPAANYSASPLAQLAQAYGLNQASSANTATGATR